MSPIAKQYLMVAGVNPARCCDYEVQDQAQYYMALVPDRSVRSIIEYNTKALYLQLHSRGNYSQSNGYEIHSVLITDGIYSSYATKIIVKNQAERTF